MTDLPSAIRTLRWMVRDTFRQSLASKLFWVMLGITVLCSVFCLSMSVNTPGERVRHPDEIPDRLPKGFLGLLVFFPGARAMTEAHVVHRESVLVIEHVRKIDDHLPPLADAFAARRLCFRVQRESIHAGRVSAKAIRVMPPILGTGREIRSQLF